MPRRASPSPLLNLPLLIIILPIVALLLLFFVVPSLLSATNQKIRSNTVKNGWDSLNVCLVLLAILCGIFARRNDEDHTANEYGRSTQNVPPVVHDNKPQEDSVSSQWFDQFSDQKIFADHGFNAPVSGTGRLKRNSSSYPDLKIESLWENSDVDDRFRFFDDFDINKYRSSSEYSQHVRQRSIFEESNVKEIQVDTFVLRSSTPKKSPVPPTPPPPPPPPRTDHKRNHTYRTVSREERIDNESEYNQEFRKINSPSPPPPTPPPRPPPPPQVRSPMSSDHKYRKSYERKRSSATREIKTVLASVLHSQRKRKKKHKAKSSSAENLIHSSSQSASFLEPSLSPAPPRPPPPVPPPPPPPPSFFHSLFRKGNKSKKIHSFSPPPPPPPPPPTSKRCSKRHGQVPPPPATPPPRPPPPSNTSKLRNSATTGRPPLPIRGTNLYDENVNSGGQSPLIPMPPPPPPPPFKVPGFRFVLKGDFVKLSSSTQSSRCTSPEPEEIDRESSSEKVNVISDRGQTVFCPSPDVNIKAASFIARLRDGWRLENISSNKEKRS